MSSPYKPSPLSFGTARASPFRRPESPSSPSAIRPTTPTSISSKPSTPHQSPTKSIKPVGGFDWTPRGLSSIKAEPSSPLADALTASPAKRRLREPAESGGALSRLNNSQVRELRECFQLLDRNSDGYIGKEDVSDMLANLGQDVDETTLSAYFPPSGAQSLTLPQFLTQLSTLLSSISSPQELLSAFAAFDEDDSGQIEITELRDALLRAAPEPGELGIDERELKSITEGFLERRAFSKKQSITSKRGEVFKYQEFIAAVGGAGAPPTRNS
ncbi:MAG: hypothetical protein M1829_005301 [Trizodia sp. TS-e1964]|nr:MAG: hypothetical protein M1829_005301 [Trizodia sp. TS-e1964]